MEALERTARRFGVESAGQDIVGAEIIQKRSRDGGLADPAFVRAYHDNCRLRHEPTCVISVGNIAPHRTRHLVRERPGRTRIMSLKPPSDRVSPITSKLPACFGWEDGRNKGEFNSLEAERPNHTASLTAGGSLKVAARDFSQARPAFSGVPKVRFEVRRKARSRCPTDLTGRTVRPARRRPVPWHRSRGPSAGPAAFDHPDPPPARQARQAARDRVHRRT